jgi:hypothetical protein
VVQAFTSPGQEPADGGLGACSAQELDVGSSHSEEDLLHSLIVDPLAVIGFHPECASVIPDGGLEVGHGDSHVVDLFEQRLLL